MESGLFERILPPNSRRSSARFYEGRVRVTRNEPYQFFSKFSTPGFTFSLSSAPQRERDVHVFTDACRILSCIANRTSSAAPEWAGLCAGMQKYGRPACHCCGRAPLCVPCGLWTAVGCFSSAAFPCPDAVHCCCVYDATVPSRRD